MDRTKHIKNSALIILGSLTNNGNDHITIACILMTALAKLISIPKNTNEQLSMYFACIDMLTDSLKFHNEELNRLTRKTKG